MLSPLPHPVPMQRQQTQLGQLTIFREAVRADPSQCPDRYQLSARPVLPV